MNRVIRVHGVLGRDGEARVYNGLQICGTGMSARSTRRVGTGRVESVTCQRCLESLSRCVTFSPALEAR